MRHDGKKSAGRGRHLLATVEELNMSEKKVVLVGQVLTLACENLRNIPR
jgi:hypothetical protein